MAIMTQITPAKNNSSVENQLRMRLRLEEEISQLGQKALSGVSIRELMDESCRKMTSILGVEYAKVLELLPDGKTLLLRSGVGWNKNVKIDKTTVEIGKNSQSGYTLFTNKPVIVEDLRTDKRFNGPRLLKSHGVVSGMSVMIFGLTGIYGVIGIHTKQERKFSKDDISYLQSVANIISLAIQRFQTEDALRQSEENFRTVSETIPHLVWVSQPDGYLEYFNQRWYEYTSTTFEEVKGTRWKALLHPEDQEYAGSLWKKCLKTGQPYEVEYRIKFAKTGEYRWVLGRAVPIRNKVGKITKWFGTCTDIHEQKKQMEMQEFLNNVNTILNSSLDYKKNLKKIAKFALPKISDMCSIQLLNDGELELVAISHKDSKKVKYARDFLNSYTADLNTRNGIGKIIKTIEAELISKVTDKTLQKHFKSQKQINNLKKIGLNSVMIVPLFVQSHCLGIITFVSSDPGRRYTKNDLDIAKEIASKVSLAIENAQLFEGAQKNEAKFKAIYDSNIIGVIYSDVKGKIYNSNDAFLQMIGYSRKDLESGKLYLDKITPPEFYDVDKLINAEILSKGKASPREKEYFKKDGSRIPVIYGAVVINQKTKECIAFVLDITERKRLEKRKDEFIGIASHELKTPLTSIKGYVQILERIIQQMGDEKLNTYLRKTNTYVDRLNSLITDLLDVSKIQAGKLEMNYETFNFEDLLVDGIESIRHTNSRYKILRDGSYPKKITGDRARLEQVFTNLLSNAIKYSPKSNRVEVKVAQKNGKVIVGIKDYGIGIPKDKINRLFTRFYRVEESAQQFSGLGIGLYISSEIVKRHGGDIWVESTEGKGSTFYFTLPRERRLG